MPSCPLSRNLLTPLLLRWDDLRKLYVLFETSPNTLSPVILISRVSRGRGGVSSWVTAPQTEPSDSLDLIQRSECRGVTCFLSEVMVQTQLGSTVQMHKSWLLA